MLLAGLQTVQLCPRDSSVNVTINNALLFLLSLKDVITADDYESTVAHCHCWRIHITDSIS